MSRTTSPSTQKSYSLVRVCRVWHLKRSTIWQRRSKVEGPAGTIVRPGPHGPCSDAELVRRLEDHPGRRALFMGKDIAKCGPDSAMLSPSEPRNDGFCV